MIEANQQDLNQKQRVKNLQQGPIFHGVHFNANLNSQQKFQDISGSGMINHQSDSLIKDSQKKRSIYDILSCIWNIFQSKHPKKETQPKSQEKSQKIQNMIKKKEYPNKSFYNKEYQDDDKIMKISPKYQQSKIQLQVKSQRSLVRMGTKTDLPAMISLKTSGGSRVGIDLVCIIDVSGSMDGEKIQLVKKTLLYILNILGPEDRLSIVKFQAKATRVCGLVNTNDQNRKKFLSFIDSLVAGGSTNILEGLQVGLKVLVNRREQNLATAIFMLSDGQDSQSVVNDFQEYQTCPQIENIGVYSLHTFGFGRDHNELIMSGLSRIKDGSFYYISNPQDLGISFVNAIGGIISVISQKVKIQIKEISHKIAQGIKIKKIYGGMWKKLNQTCYEIELLQISSGVSKDFVFQLQIPCIKKKVNDFQRDQKILEVNFISIGVDNTETVGNKILILTILNENQIIPDSVENVDVIQNFLRVRTAQSIAKNQEKADDNEFVQAEKGLDEMMAQIRNNRKVRKQYADMLANDIKRMKQKCNKKHWKQEGKKISTNSFDYLSSQTCLSFQNQIQRTLTKNLTEDKIRG